MKLREELCSIQQCQDQASRTGNQAHEAVRQFEQVTGLLQLHEYGKVGGISLEDGEVESEGRVVVAVVVEPHIQVIPEYP